MQLYTVNKQPEEPKKSKAALHLMRELEKGKYSGEEQGWIDSADVRKYFTEKNSSDLK